MDPRQVSTADQLKARFAEFWRKANEDAESARRRNEMARTYSAWGRNHPKDTPPSAA